MREIVVLVLLRRRVHHVSHGLVHGGRSTRRGAIGLVGEAIGRMGARRQAAQQRREVIEDEERRRIRELADEERRLKIQRSMMAANEILEAFLANPVRIESEDDEARVAAIRIYAVLYARNVNIDEGQLRRRLDLAVDILDLAAESALHGYSLAEAVFIVRSNCYEWIGAYLRREDLPAPDDDWHVLCGVLKEAITEWHEELEKRGRNVHPRKYRDG
jgi:hypothetical protein